ncbi:MAG TPA: pectinesterase family protein [Chitinophagaceae bacterium]|nr:pectinesterase family protein [Chitinophagaceae bacterium]
MKKFCLILFSVLFVIRSNAQRTEGITGKPDTSYTINSAYAGTIKTNPEAKLVDELHFSNLVEEKNITYCKAGDRKLLIDAFYAKWRASPKRTAIIIIHGGGWRAGNRTLHYPLAQRLAKLGYVCFTPEYRLSTEALYPAGLYDIKAAIRWVRKNAAKYNLNEDRIVVAGHSAGGELAAMMGATNGMKEFEGDGCNKNISSKVNAVIDIDGLLAFIHPESGEGDDSKRISAATNWFGYSKTENPELWKQGSPLTHVGPNSPPTLFLNSNVSRMHAGRRDYINVLNKYRIYSGEIAFNAPHSFILFNPWLDTSVVCIDRFLKSVFFKRKVGLPEAFFPTRLIVAQDGTGDFKTIQEAFNTIENNSEKRTVVQVKEGVYREKLFLDSTKRNVDLLGSDKYKTIITYDDHTGKLAPSGDTINTRTSWTFLNRSDNFLAYNITFENDAGSTAGQAVAVESDGDKAQFVDCRFIGNQDVLFLNNEKSRQFFQFCYIEGTTDFIFGSATAWFDSCEIYSKKNSHVTAASTPQTKEWGFVFTACKLTGDTSLHNVSLGRPWRPYASVVYMNCYIGAHIKPEGWSNWNNTDNYKTTRYAEYKNYGPSSDPTKRVSWSRQLTDEEAKSYDKRKYLDSWYPLNNRSKTRS